MYIKRYDEKGIRPDKETNNIFNKIFMNMTNADISVWIYGIRNLYKTANDPEINISLVGYALHSENVLNFKTNQKQEIKDEDDSEKNAESEENLDVSDDENPQNNPGYKKHQLEEEDKVNPENMTKKEEPQNEDLENNLPPVNDNQAKEYIGRVITENKNSKNLKLCSLVEFKNVPFCNDPFLWPILRIEIHDTTTFSGCESLEVKVPLIKYVNFISNKEKDKSIKMLQRAYKQKKSILDKSIETITESNHDVQLEDEEEEDESETDSSEDGNPNKNDVEGEGNGEQEESEDEKSQDGNKEMEEKRKNDPNKDDDLEDQDQERDEDHELYPLYQRNLKSIAFKNLDQKAKEKALFNMYDPDYIDTEDTITLQATQQDKLFEEFKRNKEIKILEKKNEKNIEELNKANDKEDKAIKRQIVIQTKYDIEALEDEYMDEQKFWGYAGDNDNEFEYGRLVLNDNTLEAYLKYPYSTYELRTQPELVFNELNTLIPKIANPSGDGHLRFIKLAIKVEAAGGTRMFNEKEESLDNKKGAENSYVEKVVETISSKFPFNIFIDYFIKMMRSERNYIVRVYILRCQNLAASSNSVNIKDRLAGYTAKSSANPYLRITIGDGMNNDMNGVKRIDERDKAILNNLNPEFYQTYEFDATFPEDWQLKVEVCDASSYTLGIFSDGIIGHTLINLEDRYYGDPYLTSQASLDYYKKQKMAEANELNRSKTRNNEEKEKRKEELKKELAQMSKYQSELKQLSNHKVPVEFRELLHPDKNQSQGIIEMWAEIFPIEEAKQHPMAVIKPPSKEEYEIRLIIWKTLDVPVEKDSSVNIYCKVQFDPSGWAGETIDKQTDVHYNSKDGKGEFNWRMKFKVDLP